MYYACIVKPRSSTIVFNFIESFVLSKSFPWYKCEFTARRKISCQKKNILTMRMRNFGYSRYYWSIYQNILMRFIIYQQPSMFWHKFMFRCNKFWKKIFCFSRMMDSFRRTENIYILRESWEVVQFYLPVITTLVFEYTSSVRRFCHPVHILMVCFKTMQVTTCFLHTKSKLAMVIYETIETDCQSEAKKRQYIVCENITANHSCCIQRFMLWRKSNKFFIKLVRILSTSL